MIDLYCCASPDGQKIITFFEEVGLEYRLNPVNETKSVDRTIEFSKMCPDGKIPVIVDHGGPYGSPISIFESGAILLYLAGKTGQFMPKEVVSGYKVIEWLMFQIGSVGPLLEQLHQFRNHSPEQAPFSIDHYLKEIHRTYGVIDERLAEETYLAGQYSIADMAAYPWIKWHETRCGNIGDFSNLKRWLDAIANRPAVKRGTKMMAETWHS